MLLQQSSHSKVHGNRVDVIEKKLDNYNYLYQQNTLGTFGLVSNYNKLAQHMGIDQP